ncbi:unnamed protein product [Symbiodinium sp. CCMP2592]|nr:unnamed protein product [Symbiodinium sp. CCMP2592]
MERSDDNDSEQSMSTAAATLRHMEHVVMTLDHMNEQMSDFRGIKTSLARIERSLRTIPPESGGGSRRPSDGSVTSKMSAARVDGEAMQTPKPDSEQLSSIYRLEELRAEELCSSSSRRRQGAKRSTRSPKGSPRKPAGEARDMLNLHQAGSHDSRPPESKKSARKMSRSASASAVVPDHTVDEIVPQPPVSTKPRAPTSPPAMCRRKSLDDLRQFHDAVIAAPTWVTPVSHRNSMETATALPLLGWFLLSMIGILDFFDSRKWRNLARCSLGVQIVGVIGLIAAMSTWTGDLEDLEPLITTALHFFGVAAGVLSLRRNKITCLLGPSEYLMDDYALESDFLDDWRKASKARLVQISGFFVLMISSRIAALFLTEREIFGKYKEIFGFDVLTVVAFTSMASCYCTACYCVLHVTAGLELAVDSFALRFFSTGDMEAAVMSWNIVQATLRQTSCKLSDFLVLLASSCMGALIIFAYQVASLALSGERVSVENIIKWLGWLYSPVILFLYVLSTSAAVTEKVDRLAPLVNSWSFDGRETLDASRQYVVSYILHSHAGFYVRGIRITSANVQKLVYYFAAGSFGLLANLWQR